MYTDTEAFVPINNHITTDWFSVPSGVRQGDPLSPTLFSIFINDLVETLKSLDIGVSIGQENVCILLYADDVVPIAKSEGELQSLLNSMEQWCTYWQLRVNNSKTNIMHIRNKRRKITDFTFKFDGKDLQKVNMYRYLGFRLDEHMDFDVYAEILSNAGSRALGTIVSKFKSLKNITYETFTKLYNASVIPVIEYASEVWGFSKAPSIDKIQNRALRYYLGVHRFCPIPAMYGDTGWLECKYGRYVNMLKYWNRLIKMSDNRLAKKVFLYDYECSVNGNRNWCSEIECILDDIHMLNTFLEKNECCIDEAKKELLINFENEWLEKCQSMPKLRTYVMFKSKLEKEQYLNVFMPRRNRSLLAQLRFGILPLRIETGRFKNVKDQQTGQFRRLRPEERLCEICNSVV